MTRTQTQQKPSLTIRPDPQFGPALWASYDANCNEVTLEVYPHDPEGTSLILNITDAAQLRDWLTTVLTQEQPKPLT